MGYVSTLMSILEDGKIPINRQKPTHGKHLEIVKVFMDKEEVLGHLLLLIGPHLVSHSILSRCTKFRLSTKHEVEHENHCRELTALCGFVTEKQQRLPLIFKDKLIFNSFIRGLINITCDNVFVRDDWDITCVINSIKGGRAQDKNA